MLSHISEHEVHDNNNHNAVFYQPPLRPHMSSVARDSVSMDLDIKEYHKHRSVQRVKIAFRKCLQMMRENKSNKSAAISENEMRLKLRYMQFNSHEIDNALFFAKRSAANYYIPKESSGMMKKMNSEMVVEMSESDDIDRIQARDIEKGGIASENEESSVESDRESDIGGDDVEEQRMRQQTAINMSLTIAQMRQLTDLYYDDDDEEEEEELNGNVESGDADVHNDNKDEEIKEYEMVNKMEDDSESDTESSSSTSSSPSEPSMDSAMKKYMMVYMAVNFFTPYEK